MEAMEQRITAGQATDRADLAALLSLPGMAELEALQSPVDPLALYDAMRSWTAELGRQLQSPLRQVLSLVRHDWPLAWPVRPRRSGLDGFGLALAGSRW